MEIKDLTLDKLKAENPALYKQIVESAGQKSLEEQLVEANRIIAETKKEAKLLKQENMLKGLLKESKLADVTKDRIMEDLQSTVFESEEKLKEAFTARVEKELKYLNSLSTKGVIKVPAGGKTLKENGGTEGNADLKEAETDLLKRFGIKV